MNNPNDLEIGFAELSYNEDGTPSQATFKPTMELRYDSQMLTEQLSHIPGPDTPAMVSNAQKVFAMWFNKINEIELADRSEYEIAHEVVECTEYGNGHPKKCIIRFVYRKAGKSKTIPLS